MRGVFDDRELEPAQTRRDTELTLGSGTLLTIFFGLVLLCGLCFGLGYAVGHHGAQPSVAAAQPAAAPPAEPGSSLSKPLATEQAAPAPSTQPAGAQTPPADASAPTPAAAAAQAPAIPVQAAAAPGQPLVHPALAPTPVAGQAVPAAPAGGLMVQIAAVSNTEDADVLTSALRKRGYAVTARRDPADNLIHVRIGPFATVAQANTWKMRLLNDGYNAIVQQ